MGPASSAGLGSERYDTDCQGRRCAAQRLFSQDHRGDDPCGWRPALNWRLTALMTTAPVARSLIELRLLDGPNLYFPRPATKVTLDLTELLELPTADALDLGTELGLGKVRPGAPGSVFRQRFAIRLVTQIVRRLARIGGVTRLAVRTRAGKRVSELVVPTHGATQARAEALAYGLARVLDSLAAGPEAVAEMINTEGAALAVAPRLRSPADSAPNSRRCDHRYQRQDHDTAHDRTHRAPGRVVSGLVEHGRRIHRR